MTKSQPLIAVPKLDIVLPPSADGASFEMYRMASAADVQIALPEGGRAQDFFVDGATWQLPQATLTRVRSCAQLHRRDAGEIDSGVTPTIQLFLIGAGEVDMVCDGQQMHFGAGDIIVHDSRRRYESKVSAFDVHIVMVSRDRVPPIFLSPDVHGLRLPAEAAGTRLVAAAVEALAGAIGDLAISEADHAVMAIFQLAAGLVETQLARRASDHPHRRTEPPLAAALAFIEHRLRDPDLGPEALRAHLRISRSAIYRLFAPLGGIDAAIRHRRLDVAMCAILADAAPRLPIRDLAPRLGFRGVTQFERAFQALFGHTPTLVRDKVAAADKAWLKAQAKRAGFSSLRAWQDVLAADPVPTGTAQPTPRSSTTTRPPSAGRHPTGLAS